MTTEALTAHQILVKVLKAHQPQSLVHGKYHPVFQSLSQRHSAGQAAGDRHDRFYRSYAHAGWGERQIELVSRAPEAKNFAEICAWAQTGDAERAAEMIYASWLSSPDHWAIFNAPYDFWGYSMAQSRSGVWYATGIVGVKR